ncbi:ABC multidrug transporter mdr2 [Dactylonectria estremocensis]|uniref:ABC multidrug transporter mdr2 n=1 Tax=Dactylonectria estremocensis TaxID=1079267 RepID=A0A9P9EPH0_9HYPO|nr:ABC multidrug transporter mdr2 [Dactylonectria estremocensis]
MAYNDDSVLARLSSLNESHDSIATAAQWIMFHRRHADRTVQLWVQRLRDSSSTKRLSLVYLANEVAQQSKIRHKDDFIIAFAPVMAEAISIAYKGAPADIQSKLKRVVDVWKDRAIFEAPIQAAIDGRIGDLDKARGSAKSGFGGSPFGSGTPAIPSEFAPLVTAHQSVGKLSLPLKATIASANQEYEKHTDSSTPVPSAPVYAARLNGLLKNLANAESAVAECVKAREGLLSGLEKLLNANRAALDEEKASQAQLLARKSEVEEKKHQVELAIMRALGPAETNGEPGEAGSANAPPEPDRPEMEALTPPAMEAFTPPAMEDEPFEPATLVQESVQETNSETQAIEDGVEVLPNLAPSYQSLPISINGANKRRRVDDDDDFPDLGEGDGIDPDPGSPLLQTRLFHASPSRQSLHPPFSVAAFRSSASTPQPYSQFSQLRDQAATRFFSAKNSSRQFSTAPHLLQKVQTKSEEGAKKATEPEEQKTPEEDGQKHEFQKSERAARAAQVNLSAKLSKEGKGAGGKAGFAEVWRLIKIARPELRWLSVAFVFLVISSSVTMSIPFSVGRILDLASKGEAEDIRLFGLTLSQFFFSLGAILTVGAMANFGRVVLLRIVGERVVARLRSQLYRRTYVQDAEFFDANRVGDLISRLSSDTVIVGKSVTQNISDGLRALFSGGAGFAIMVWTSPKLTGLLLLMFPPIAVGAFLYGRAIRNISRAIQKNLGSLTKIAEERLGNIKTSQAFVGEVQEVSRYNRQIRKIFALGKRESLVAATFFASTGWAGNMTILAMLIVGGNFVRSGAMSMGELTSFMMYTAFAGSSLFGLSGFYSELMKGVGAASRLFELQDRKPGIHQTVGVPVKSAQGLIKFSDVTFAYPTRPAVKIFNGLNFEIAAGSNVCVVGPSGGGKSTVASLLLRFYNPTSGQITINGVDVSTMNVKSLRRRIGMVSQEPVLFSGTIAENIAYGKPNANRVDVIAAARRANCSFISDLPDGLETQVGARGSQLSGGQKQRIAIARALLKDPDILILDEATSALDAESETLVNEALAGLLRSRNTTISIAHRLSTIKRSDQIIVLNNEGKVAEIGSYTQLAADPESAFSKLMEWQMSGGEVQPEKRISESRAHITEAEELEDDLERREEADAEELEGLEAEVERAEDTKGNEKQQP